MILNMKRLFDVTDESEEFSFEIGTDELKERVFSVEFASPLAVSVRAYNRAGIVYVDLKCDFTLSHVCDRCLAEFKREYSYDFSHVCMRDQSSNDEHIIVKGNGNDLILLDAALDQIIIKQLKKQITFSASSDPGGD